MNIINPQEALLIISEDFFLTKTVTDPNVWCLCCSFAAHMHGCVCIMKTNYSVSMACKRTGVSFNAPVCLEETNQTPAFHLNIQSFFLSLISTTDMLFLDISSRYSLSAWHSCVPVNRVSAELWGQRWVDLLHLLQDILGKLVLLREDLNVGTFVLTQEHF